jgi:hypothetical protein
VCHQKICSHLYATYSNFFDPRTIPSGVVQFSPLKSPDTWTWSSLISTMPWLEEHRKAGNVGRPWRRRKRRALPRAATSVHTGKLPLPPRAHAWASSELAAASARTGELPCFHRRARGSCPTAVGAHRRALPTPPRACTRASCPSHLGCARASSALPPRACAQPSSMMFSQLLLTTTSLL